MFGAFLFVLLVTILSSVSALPQSLRVSGTFEPSGTASRSRIPSRTAVRSAASGSGLSGTSAPSGTAVSSRFPSSFSAGVGARFSSASWSHSSKWTTAVSSEASSSSPSVTSTTSEVATSSSSTSIISSSSSTSLSSVWSTVTTSSHVTTTTTSSSTPTPTSDYMRGVNIGGWLVLEKWMDSDVFDGSSATDQYTFDQTSGAASKLQTHWSTYFTEADVQTIASYGINALRIPIGYWAYNNTGTPYITGADAWLEKAIGWARSAGLKVLVDCHGSPGSQNGFDNSGEAGSVLWQTGDNLDKSITVLETMAKKYGSQEYADVVFGIELVNEPLGWSPNDFGTTKQWAQKAFKAVKAAATNPNLVIIMHDAFMGPSNWLSTSQSIDSAQFALDTHLYQNQVAADSQLTQDQHIAKACNWTTSALLPKSSNLPVYVGEFSAATNICANPDGSTTAGTSCSTSGCQCASNVGIQGWNAPLIAATRKFYEAQMDAFESASTSTKGHFLWSFKGDGAWGLENAVKYGLIGPKITDRKYPGQCSSYSS